MDLMQRISSFLKPLNVTINNSPILIRKISEDNLETSEIIVTKNVPALIRTIIQHQTQQFQVFLKHGQHGLVIQEHEPAYHINNSVTLKLKEVDSVDALELILIPKCTSIGVSIRPNSTWKWLPSNRKEKLLDQVRKRSQPRLFPVTEADRAQWRKLSAEDKARLPKSLFQTAEEWFSDEAKKWNKKLAKK
jgi:hypothetical protein